MKASGRVTASTQTLFTQVNKCFLSESFFPFVQSWDFYLRGSRKSRTVDFGVFLASGSGKPSTDGRLSRRILQAARTVSVQDGSKAAAAARKKL